LNDESGIVVLIDIPKSREREFRQNLVPLGAVAPAEAAETEVAPNERRFLQVRVITSAADQK
jgi:hypothetical protein